MIGIVGIDPGHGGKDHGAGSYGVCEGAYVFQFSADLADRLRANRYYSAISRLPDEDPIFSERSLRLRHTSPVFVIHVNAGPEILHGSTFFYNSANQEARQLAEKLVKFWPATLRRTHNSIFSLDAEKLRREEYKWLAHAWNTIKQYKQPAILCELFFCTNEEDAKRGQDSVIRELMLWAFIRCLDNS